MSAERGAILRAAYAVGDPKTGEVTSDNASLRAQLLFFGVSLVHFLRHPAQRMENPYGAHSQWQTTLDNAIAERATAEHRGTGATRLEVLRAVHRRQTSGR